MTDAAIDPPAMRFYRTVEVGSKAKVDTSTVRRDITSGNIKAAQFGRDYLFNQEQYDTAIRYYRAKAREKRNAIRTRRGVPAQEV